MALWDSPTFFGILNKKDFDIFLIFGETKNDATRGRLTDDFLNGRLFVKDGGFDFLKRRGLKRFRRQGFRNLERPPGCRLGRQGFSLNHEFLLPQYEAHDKRCRALH